MRAVAVLVDIRTHTETGIEAQQSDQVRLFETAKLTNQMTAMSNHKTV